MNTTGTPYVERNMHPKVAIVSTGIAPARFTSRK